ncbi:SRPBCC family protein [Salinadaptatus halalkaliphilus]|uniref:SRPBCC family protein n=1 Tax=Salinadaptatus halalkaliphilus TaxID=2419781 RepID=A0A4S3TKM6_9EURY|nr:SRPBCC family protein [Salinadaptatus halalkaliphilus]THE63793.1 SRPBCC family protein [Salinadaptatus halalkaliphilus]
MTRLRTTQTPSGLRLEASQVLAVAPETAWDPLVDTTRWPEWSPVVTAVEATDRRVCEGTTGRVRTPGVWLPFRVTTCSERRWTWRIGGVPSSGHRVDDLGPQRCRVAFELPLQSAGTAPICLAALERIDELLTDD